MVYISDIQHDSLSLQQKLQTLYALRGEGKPAIALGFRAPYMDLLAAFGNPHVSLPPVIHVAGTNGKGSIIAVMRAALESAGLRVHVYTSPHLVRFNERIVLDSVPIADEALEVLIDEALHLNQGAEVTFFEITTAMAFAAFARTPADVVLLETGLGGRLDCTNVVPSAAVTVIGSIGYDHQEFLGRSIADIAREKAGIMKRGVPCVIAPQRTNKENIDVVSVLHTASKEKQSVLYRNLYEWDFTPLPDGFTFVHDGAHTRYPMPILQGHHQIENAATAVMALKLFAKQTGLSVTDKHIAAGIAGAVWPARMQDISDFHTGLQQAGWRVFLDGGHNADAACTMAQNFPPHSLTLVLGMMGHKDIHAFLEGIAPAVRHMYAVPIAGEPHAARPQDIKAHADAIGLSCVIAESWRDALARVSHQQNQDQKTGKTILIAGSLYLAGQVLQVITNKAG